MGMKLIFCLQINTKVVYKMIVSLWLCVARHAQNTQKKFAISLQYLKKELSDEVDFLHVHEHEILLQIDAMILLWIIKYSQSFQNSKFAMSLQSLKKEVLDEVDFLHAD